MILVTDVSISLFPILSEIKYLDKQTNKQTRCDGRDRSVPVASLRGPTSVLPPAPAPKEGGSVLRPLTADINLTALFPFPPSIPLCHTHRHRRGVQVEEEPGVKWALLP